MPAALIAILTWSMLAFLALLPASVPAQVITSNDLSLLQAQAIRRLMAKDIAKDFYLIKFPSQGNFNWFYENMAGDFNAYTYNYLSGAVKSTGTTGLAKLEASGTFPNGWNQMLYNTTYRLSTAEAEMLDSITALVSPEGLTVLTTYESIFGNVSNFELTEAQVVWGIEYLPTKLDYVINIIIGEQWSCRDSNYQEPMTWSQLASCPDLVDSLPCMPDSGLPVITALENYIGLLESAYEIQDQLSEGVWTLFNLKINTTQPSAQNGGMITFDPQTGERSASDQVGYAVQKPLLKIMEQLNDSTRSLFVNLDFTILDSIYVIAYFLNYPFKGDSLGISYMEPDTFGGMSGNGRSLLSFISYKYTGLCGVDCTPSYFDDQTICGWFQPQILADAWENEGQDLTGYYFNSAVAYTPYPVDSGGNAAWLNSLLICNEKETKLANSTIMKDALLKPENYLRKLLRKCQASEADWFCEVQQQTRSIEKTEQNPAEIITSKAVTNSAFMRSAIVVGAFLATVSDFF